jgi:putative ABC transport system permease protein
VSAGYFDAMNIPLTDGRGVRPSDNGDANAERVLVVNQSFVRRYFPDERALGAQLRIFGADAPPARIVGVAGDVTQFTLDQPAEPVIYVPWAQAPDWQQDEPWIVLRTAGDPGALLAAARSAIREIEPHAPVYAAQPMQAIVSATLARPRFRTFLLLSFAGIAFLLAALGVYGMVAYAASRRLPELGVRVALGAQPGSILQDVVGRGLRPVVAGAAAGVVLGFLAVRFLRSFVYGVSVTDPLTFLAVPLLLLVVATAAAWFPGRRASHVDPMEVLRAE